MANATASKPTVCAVLATGLPARRTLATAYLVVCDRDHGSTAVGT